MDKRCNLLLAKVIENAIKGLTGPKDKKEQRLAKEWFESRDYYIGSFSFCCQVLGYNAEAIMKQVFKNEGILCTKTTDIGI